MIWKQYHSNVFYAGAKRELFVYPAIFPHLPEHLASRYRMSYYMHVLPWYLILMAYNTIQVHEPQAETDNLKIFWFWPNVCSQYKGF